MTRFSRSKFGGKKRAPVWSLALTVLLMAMLSCSFPGLSTSTPTASPFIPTAANPTSSQNLLPATRTPIIPTFTLAPTKTVAPTSTKAPTLTPTLAFNFTLQRQASQVFFGSAEPLQPVNSDAPQPFPNGFLVNTDQSGQALLRGMIDGEQCHIFLFFATKLQKKACPQSSFTSGNASCVEEGSTVFENCRNHLITTPSGAAQLLGTWASVTYMADSQASVYVVLKGSIEVQPVRRIRGYQMASNTTVNAGEFYYTAPDNVMAQDPDLPGRRAHPVDRLPSLLQIYPAMNQYLQVIFDTSKQSNLNFPDPNLLTGPADLVTHISTYQYTRNSISRLPTLAGAQFVYLPLRIMVTNRGGTDTGAFKIAVQGRTANSGTFSRPFFLNGDPQTYYINVDNLPPGGQEEFTGFVAFLGEQPNTTAWVTAEADSCSGDELMPEYCRVQEYDENNNVSNELKAPLTNFAQNFAYP
jgi:hypothetical protein